MDLIPKPDQVASAASNVAHMVLYGGLADLRPMPRTLIDDGPLREVYHYRPQKKTRETGDPILLVTPLAAPAICYDLRRDCSLVEHFVQKGRPTYLVEYGEISFKNRRLGLEHWVDEVVPEAIKTVSEHAGGRPVHVVGWSLGGIFAALAAADNPDLPIASLTLLGTPFDVKQVPMVAPLRPILSLTDGGIVTQLYRVLGGAPKPLVRQAFRLSSGTKMFTKPVAILQHLDDSEWLAQIEAVDRFTDNMIAYPGRTFGQLYHRMLKANELLSAREPLRPRDRRRQHQGPRPDLRRQHRRHRADQVGPGTRPAAQERPRGPLRDRPRWPPRHAHRSRGPRDDLGDHGRVDRGVLHTRRPGDQLALRQGQEDREVRQKKGAKKAASGGTAKKAPARGQPSPLPRWRPTARPSVPTPSAGSTQRPRATSRASPESPSRSCPSRRPRDRRSGSSQPS